MLFRKAHGFRNRGEGLPNNIDTSFTIASGTKLFTAAAVCILVDQGRLSLDSKICELLPHDLKNIDKNITVFHLLTHSAGVADYLNDALNFDDDAAMERFYAAYPVHTWTTHEFFLQLFCRLPGKFAPGERASYSNSNFILLGLIIEAVTGGGYREFVMANVAQTLGLANTGFYATNNLPANTAIGYMLGKQQNELVGN
ncbi:MAG: beta-lactamase family protein [Defluviitaleaceae bacterium]|nr:beta-lactamase family protein [Defluviitaleaceae bacterium]